VAAKAAQDPQDIWFLTGVTNPRFDKVSEKVMLQLQINICEFLNVKAFNKIFQVKIVDKKKGFCLVIF